MTVPVSVLSYGHRAWICHVDPRPTTADHGLVEFIGGHEVQKAEISERVQKILLIFFLIDGLIICY